ncbi:MAG: AraC-like DNA-binding protein [Oleiphilaceae bacterium]|jgi:AraC-like DNA-binding protein
MHTSSFSLPTSPPDSKKTLGLATETSISHHIKGLRPALTVMETLGYKASQCLKGSGISSAYLEQSDQGISLQQELAFYRRLLDLSQDPQLGLQLGKAYRLENYGMLGYAILSAQTLGEALKIAKDFGPLSFSHFELDFSIDNTLAKIIMRRNKSLDESLMTLYEDRDCTAILNGAISALGKPFPILGIELMHSKPADIAEYERLFQCPVSFEKEHMSIEFSADILSIPMPLRDPETSAYCRLQCQQLLKKMSHQQSLSAQIELLFTQAKSGLPSLAELSETLGIPERTMRRKLTEEGYKFQDLLNEARFDQAKTLLNSDLNLNEIAEKLGYSEAGNFSHAFKRWSGVSPKAYRAGLLKE